MDKIPDSYFIPELPIGTAYWMVFDVDGTSPEEYREKCPAKENYDICIRYNGKAYKFNLEDASSVEDLDGI